MRLCLSLLLVVLMYGFARAQTGGSMYDPAVLPNPMDPNGDGWITASGSAFTGPLDETQFELPFRPIPAYQAEPGPDNQVPSSSCTKYELVGDAANGAESTYYYWQDPNGIPDTGDERVFFRFRVARLQNSSVGLSILIDTDHKFGFSGPEADPNAVAGNPGFELEVTAPTSGGSQIRVYNADGLTNPTVVLATYSTDTNMQVAYALNQDADCSTWVPGFVDIYLPFSALGISSATQIRMVGAARESTGTNLGGNASDISGVDGDAILGDDDQFIAVIGSYPPFTFRGVVNRAPSCMDRTLSLIENSPNGTAVLTVSASDPDGDALTYTITAGNTGTAFAINSSGQITVSNAAALDFETTSFFSLTVTVSDKILSASGLITINLNDVNETPAATDVTLSINENSANGTAVHTVSASDPDGDALYHTITAGNSGTAFSINSSGQISVNNTAALDYETTSSFSLTVSVSDGTLSDDAVITINLNDVNETPKNVNQVPVADNATISVDENSATGTTVHNISASDPDGDALTYAITAGNAANAFLVGDDGVITVNDFSQLDFETTPTFYLTVQISDGERDTQVVVTIKLRNLNEHPGISDALIRIAENLPRGSVVHQFVSEDPDANDTAIFSIEAGNANSAFGINASTGELIIDNIEAFDLLQDPAFELIVMVTDAGGLTATAKLTILLDRVEERNVIEPLRGFSPNGDGENDFWFIKGIEAFPDNEVKVFNRWGNLVFETQTYDNLTNAWRGLANDNLPEMTYFFVITVKGMQPVTGYVIVKR